MIQFFGNINTKIFAVQTTQELSKETISKLSWLFGNQPLIEQASIDAFFVGPRAAMITPWSTNAVEITQNMGISGIIRIEEFKSVSQDYKDFDPMISEKYSGLNQDIFTIDKLKKYIKEVEIEKKQKALKTERYYNWSSHKYEYRIPILSNSR